MKLLLSHKTKKCLGKFDCILFKAKEIDEYHSHNKQSNSNGWDKFIAKKQLLIFNIEGSHSTCLYNSSEEIVNIINSYLSADGLM